MLKDIILKRAESMSAIEQHQYGCSFVKNGEFDTALKIFLMAEKKGNIDAKYSIAMLYYFGNGVKKDTEYAIKILRELSNKKHGFANYMLGEVYREGKFVEKDYLKAVEFYKKAVKQDNVFAIQNLALMYEHGMGVEQNIDEAIKLYERGAKLKNVNSMYNLAIKYAEIKNKPDEAIKLLEEAFRLGDIESKSYLGQMYHEGQGVEVDYKKSMEHYEQAAKSGDGKAYFNIAMMYLRGEGVEASQQKAFEYFQKSAQFDIPEAYNSLAQMFFLGEGIEQDVEKGIYYYKKAAKKGHVDATYNLAVFYHKGNNVDVDYQKAIKYYQKAIELGCVDALNNLGTMYAMGEGLEKDIQMATKYYELAAEGGNVGAKFNVGETLYGQGFEDAETAKKAIAQYESFIESKEDVSNDVYIYYAYIRLVQCYFDLHCYQESNEKNRDIYYYKKAKDHKNKAKQYCTLVEEYVANNTINPHAEIQLVFDVYKQVINDDDLEIDKINYNEFRNKFYNKHQNLFLMTKNNQHSVFDGGIKMYFDKKGDALNLFNEEIKEQKDRLIQRKAMILQQMKKTNISVEDDKFDEIINMAEDNVKQEYVEDYSVSVINIDKHLEEILHYVFVESFHDFKIKQIQLEIKNNLQETTEKCKVLANEFLGNVKEVIVGKALPESAKSLKESNIKTIVRLMHKFEAQNNLDADTLGKISQLEQYSLNNTLSEEEHELINLILKTKDLRLEMENSNSSNRFELGSLFHMTFMDIDSDDGLSGVTQKVMNGRVIEFVKSLNPNKPEFDVKVKLRELLLKVEMFRVTTRNVASHKSILTKALAEKGINLAICQNNSIFDLMDELFGDFINQKYIESLIEKFNAKSEENKEDSVETEESFTI